MEIEKMWIKGMDVSFLDEIEQGGGTFHEGPDKVDVLELLQRSGTSSIRLRVWNDPPGGYCNLERTLMMAKRVKELGMHLLLDFHYSDKWADPANQWKPAAWEGLQGAALEQAVYEYTYEVMAVLRAGGALPDMVQIGNEITNGMLWPDAKVDPKAEAGADEEPWARLCGLLKSGASAVRSVDRSVRVMLHIDRGGDPDGSRTFFERMEAEGVPFDVIGLSYYPWWQAPWSSSNGICRICLCGLGGTSSSWKRLTHGLFGLGKDFPSSWRMMKHCRPRSPFRRKASRLI